MGDLGNATELGGAVVTISVDSGAVRQGLAQASSTVQQEVDRISRGAKIKLGVDGAHLQQAMRQATQGYDLALPSVFSGGPATPYALAAGGFRAGPANAGAAAANHVQPYSLHYATPMLPPSSVPNYLGGGIAGSTSQALINNVKHLSALGGWEWDRGGANLSPAKAVKRVEKKAEEAAEGLDELAKAAKSASGGGGAAGGRGQYGNPFSERGLARLLGNAAAVYGTSEVVRLAAGIMSAQNTMANSGKYLREFDYAMPTGSAYGDAYLQKQAKTIAGAEGSIEALDAIKSIPVIGSLAALADAAMGLSQAFREESDVARHAAQVHLESIHELDQQTVGWASLTRNPLRVQQAQANLRLDVLRKRAEENPDDQSAQLAYAQAQAQEQVGMNQSAYFLRDMPNVFMARHAQSLTDQGKAAFGVAGAELSGNPTAQLAAYHVTREVERKAMEDDYARKLEEDRATGGLHLLALGQERLGALKKFDYETTAGAMRLDYGQFRSDRQLAGEVSSLGFRTDAAQYTASRRPLEARISSINASLTSQLAGIDNTPRNAELRKSIEANAQAEKDAARFEFARQHDNAAASLETRFSQSNYQMQRLDGAARTLGEVQSLMSELRNAPPDLHHQTARTVLAELDVMQMKMQARGGIFAETGDAYSVFGDPLNRERNMKDRAAQRAEIEEGKRQAEAALKGQEQTPINLDKTNDLLSKILAKIGLPAWK